MPYHAINNMAMRVWRAKGLESVTTTANGFILFRFKNQANLQGVLEQGPWLFVGKHLILQKWDPRFQFDAGQIKTLPVWIRLKGLPLPLWTTKGLSLVASMVGKPLSCDEATHKCSRLEYARICVEIDAEMAYVHKFEVVTPLSTQAITIHVEYEWKPARCNTCHVFGHSCGEKTVKDPTAVMVAAEETPPQTMQNLGHADGATADGADANKQPGGKADARSDKGKQIAHVQTCTEIGGDVAGKTDTATSKSISLSNKMATNRIGIENRTDTFPSQVSTNEDTGESSHAIDKPPDHADDDSPSPSLKAAKKKKGGKHKKAVNGQLVSVTFFSINFMFKVESWNIRGLNSPKKQKTVHAWTTKNKLDIIGLLEVKISSENMEAVQKGLMLSNWNHVSNDEGASTGRILVSWNAKKCSLICVHKSQQWITCEVKRNGNPDPWRVTFVYGHNTPTERAPLWSYIMGNSQSFSAAPWLVLGDFNAVIQRSDGHGGSIAWHKHHTEFGSCITNAELMQIAYTGLRHTWHNGRENALELQGFPYGLVKGGKNLYGLKLGREGWLSHGLLS
ncbi:hypothetical protein DKX38_006357 [Salix brachista]|uniref:Uncharacterized protein n=1 Tax=Salix brachista TaxID=2182728 RepID=A0A5N5N1I5_9ROSI|nr:hypothetical protein DKX38_006357 [Salix brachista]